MQLDTPALVFIATAMAAGGACLSYLKARFHTTDHHLMIFVLVGAVGYLAPLHIERASQLERERLKQTWAGTGRSFAHELERTSAPLQDIDTNGLQRTMAQVSDRLSISSADLWMATLVTPKPDKTFKRVTVGLGLSVVDPRVAEGFNPKIEQAMRDQEGWCEEKDAKGKVRGIGFLIPLRDQKNVVAGVLMVDFDADHWVFQQEIAQWRVAGEFLGLLSICLLMSGILVTTAETRRRKEMDEAIGPLKAEVESLDGMVNAVHGVVWERPVGSQKFSFVSQQADGFLGYSISQWTTDHGLLEDVIHEEDLPRAKAAWKEAAERCSVYHIEYRVRRADGGTSHVSEHGQGNRVPVQRTVLRGILVDITAQREAEASVKDMHRMMVEASRQAGMAEIATGVLHNVGNVLNSLNVGSKLLLERMQRSRLDRLCQATSLLKEHLPEDMDFFVQDKRGRALPGYLDDLSGYLRDEQNRLTANVRDMIERIDHIRDIIMLQQSHSRVQTLWEPLDLATVMEDALRLEASAHGGHEPYKVERQYADLPTVYQARGLLLQILVNLLSNASQAMAELPAAERRLTLRIGPNGSDGVRIVVEDNGCGIPVRNLTDVFNQGFTTKRDGHGFGLHHASLLVDDLGGTLKAESEGTDKGARFVLDLPARNSPPSQELTLAATPAAAPGDTDASEEPTINS